jgi:hypothetical protein
LEFLVPPASGVGRRTSCTQTIGNGPPGLKKKSVCHHDLFRPHPAVPRSHCASRQSPHAGAAGPANRCLCGKRAATDEPAEAPAKPTTFAGVALGRQSKGAKQEWKVAFDCSPSLPRRCRGGRQARFYSAMVIAKRCTFVRSGLQSIKNRSNCSHIILKSRTVDSL